MNLAKIQERDTCWVSVSGRETVAGPLQESLRLELSSTALSVQRGRLLQALRGGVQAIELPLADIDRVEATFGGGVLLHPRPGARLGGITTLHGEAAALALAAWWAMGGAEDGRVVATRASEALGAGLVRSGIAVGGPAGIAFVPTDWTGSLDDTLRRLPLRQIEQLATVADGVQVTGRGGVCLTLAKPVATLSGVAAWLSHELGRDTLAPARTQVGGFMEARVLWQVDDGACVVASVQVAQGRMSLATPAEGRQPLTVPVGRVEHLESRDSRLVVRMAGSVHTLTVLGAQSQRVCRRLAGLVASRPLLGGQRVDLESWRPLCGSHHTARVFQGAGVEDTLHDAVVDIVAGGLRLCGRSVETGRPPFEAGVRVRVTLPDGRGWQHFSAMVGSHSQASSGQVTSVELLLEPVDAAPRAGPRRRALHRVADHELSPFFVTRAGDPAERLLDARLVDLSAGGFGAWLTERASSGDRFMVELPTAAAGPALLAEVVYARWIPGPQGRTTAGFRFVGLTEGVRARLQREVLRRERVSMMMAKRSPVARWGAAAG